MSLSDIARKLVEGNRYCTLATASLDGKPEAATIQYASKDFELYFETMTSYRKYANLRMNPQASVVITELPKTLQMDGIVKQLSGNDADGARQLLVIKLGEVPTFYRSPDIRFFSFTPTWIRLLTNKGWPPEYETIAP
jgi:hypothetical protein